MRWIFLWLLWCGPALAYPVQRCMNLSAALEAPVEGAWGYTIRQDDIARIAQAGFDTVRLPVRFSAHWRGDHLDPALLARVDQVIAWANAQGLNTIVDLHHFWDLFEDPSPRNVKKLHAIWAALADHFQTAPPSVIFELLNEPEPPMTHTQVANIIATLRAQIRRTHPTRWIITGAADWNDWMGLRHLPPADPYEVRTFHLYDPFEFTHQGAPYIAPLIPPAPWGSPNDHAKLDALIAQIAGEDGPLFMGEFGTYDAAPRADAMAWTRAVRQAADRHGIAWCYWGFSQGDQPGFQAFETANNAWRPGILDALLGD